MRTRFALAAIAAACLSTAAAAQMGPGMDHRGMGPGMAAGQGMGPGMMGGQGHGPGMMGGQAGCGMGAGTMGRHGMGRGMMGGHGMGAGKMGGQGFAALEKLNLNDEQRAKVREIRRDMQRKQHGLMGSMREVRWQSEDVAKSAEFDEAAARKNYDAMAAIRKQVFEARLDAHKRIEGVLTREQREELRKSLRSAGPGPR